MDRCETIESVITGLGRGWSAAGGGYKSQLICAGLQYIALVVLSPVSLTSHFGAKKKLKISSTYFGIGGR